MKTIVEKINYFINEVDVPKDLDYDEMVKSQTKYIFESNEEILKNVSLDWRVRMKMNNTVDSYIHLIDNETNEELSITFALLDKNKVEIWSTRYAVDGEETNEVSAAQKLVLMKLVIKYVFDYQEKFDLIKTKKCSIGNAEFSKLVKDAAKEVLEAPVEVRTHNGRALVFPNEALIKGYIKPIKILTSVFNELEEQQKQNRKEYTFKNLLKPTYLFEKYAADVAVAAIRYLGNRINVYLNEDIVIFHFKNLVTENNNEKYNRVKVDFIDTKEKLDKLIKDGILGATELERMMNESNLEPTGSEVVRISYTNPRLVLEGLYKLAPEFNKTEDEMLNEFVYRGGFVFSDVQKLYGQKSLREVVNLSSISIELKETPCRYAGNFDFKAFALPFFDKVLSLIVYNRVDVREESTEKDIQEDKEYNKGITVMQVLDEMPRTASERIDVLTKYIKKIE